MRIVPPSDAPMTWALAASAVVHAGIAVALVTGPAGLPSAPMRVDLPLRAEIATPLPPLARADIAAFEDVRNGLFLDRGRCGVAHGFERIQQGLAQLQIFK